MFVSYTDDESLRLSDMLRTLVTRVVNFYLVCASLRAKVLQIRPVLAKSPHFLCFIYKNLSIESHTKM